jgi:DNA processing protein
MAPLTYWVWLSALSGIGTATKFRLLRAFGSPEQIFFADERAYHDADIALTHGEKAALQDKSLFDARRILDVCGEGGYRILTISDAEYPARLRNIEDPPVVLYVRGTLPVIDEEVCIGVVGTRSCTPYGLKTAERLGYEVTRNGLLVVTGLARGIDSAAALGALRAGGRVVGVLGTGVDVVYPKENGELFEDVAAVGALVSEYPPGTPALSSHFPRRNRIISGLACGVVIVEAPLRSGALITAALALEQGRDVFAVPGNADSTASRGANRLIREGAILVTSGDDIADEYEALYPEKIHIETLKVPLDGDRLQALNERAIVQNRQKTQKIEIDNDKSVEYIDLVQLAERLDEMEMQIVSVLAGKTMHIDDVITQTGMTASDVLASLTLLEVEGIAEQLPGKMFRIPPVRG